MLVVGDQDLRAAKDATATIPIIVLACDPLDSLVVSISRPGGKATSMTCISSELAGKRLQLLKKLVPSLAHVAVLYNPEDHNKESEYKQSQEAAGRLKLTLHAYKARSSIEIDRAYARLADDHAQALVIFVDVLTVAHQKRLADLALENRLPAMFGLESSLIWKVSSPTVRAIRDVATGCHVCGQDPKRRQSERSANRTANALRAGHKSEDREDAQPRSSCDAAHHHDEVIE